MKENPPTPSSVLKAEIGDRLRVGRIALGMSQGELAVVLEREAKERISDLEHGKIGLSEQDVVRLDQLGLRPGYLYLNRLSDLDSELRSKIVKVRKKGLKRLPRKT